MTGRCKMCDAPMDVGSFGRKRKFCSERCRKRQYDKTCVDCGGRVDGTSPSRMANPDEPRCASCSTRKRREDGAQKVWTRDRIISAIRAWEREFGEPPAVRDWNPHKALQLGDVEAARVFIERRSEFPWFSVVYREFGTWNAAIIAAGFEPRARHGGAGNWQRRRRYREAA